MAGIKVSLPESPWTLTLARMYLLLDIINKLISKCSRLLRLNLESLICNHNTY